MNQITYEHKHAAHCESGVTSILMSHHGLPVTEPMAFGLGEALMFAFFPFIKIGDMPLVAFRSVPRSIIRKLQKNLGIRMRMQTFSNPEEGMRTLDKLIDQGTLVGIQTSAYWLPYFPEEMRFHFNVHNSVVYGKEGDEYLIGDPVFDHPVRCPATALKRARFVKGLMAPKGLIYYPMHVPREIDYERLVPLVVKKTARRMLKTPVPVAGIRAIRSLARTIGNLRQRDPRYAKLFLGHVIRMQEEIGTGGAGFRFIYASFLQEAGTRTGNECLREASEMMTACGDRWREFAYMAATIIRNRENGLGDIPALKEKLERVADAEAEVFRVLANDMSGSR